MGLFRGCSGLLRVFTGMLIAKNRSTFGKVIANRQLIQSKLVDMISDHVKGLLLAWRLGVLKDIGKLKSSYVLHA